MKYLLVFLVICLASIFPSQAVPQPSHTLVKRSEPFGIPVPALRFACRTFALIPCPEWDSIFAEKKSEDSDKDKEKDKDNNKDDDKDADKDKEKDAKAEEPAAEGEKKEGDAPAAEAPAS